MQILEETNLNTDLLSQIVICSLYNMLLATRKSNRIIFLFVCFGVITEM